MKGKSMEKVQMIEIIDNMRDYMHNLINEKGDLTHPEVVLISQILDSKLNEYNKLAS